jgi:site-specific DNA-methyltransferase (adenine-specific)
MFVLSKGKPKTAKLLCDKENKWAGVTNWGKNTKRDKNNDLKIVNDIKPVPQFSPRNNIWEYVVGGGFATKDKEAHSHPAIFPENLLKTTSLLGLMKEILYSTRSLEAALLPKWQ